MNKLRTLLPGQHAKDSARNSVALEPEIGFQITIETHDPKEGSEQSFAASNGSSGMPELNVHLIAARHLPSLFGFKIVQGYLIKVIKSFTVLAFDCICLFRVGMETCMKKYYILDIDSINVMAFLYSYR